MQITLDAGKITASPDSIEELAGLMSHLNKMWLHKPINLVCPQCKTGEAYKTETGLAVHMARMHGKHKK